MDTYNLHKALALVAELNDAELTTLQRAIEARLAATAAARSVADRILAEGRTDILRLLRNGNALGVNMKRLHREVIECNNLQDEAVEDDRYVIEAYQRVFEQLHAEGAFYVWKGRAVLPPPEPERGDHLLHLLMIDAKATARIWTRSSLAHELSDTTNWPHVDISFEDATALIDAHLAYGILTQNARGTLALSP